MFKITAKKEQTIISQRNSSKASAPAPDFLTVSLNFCIAKYPGVPALNAVSSGMQVLQTFLDLKYVDGHGKPGIGLHANSVPTEFKSGHSLTQMADLYISSRDPSILVKYKLG